MAYIAIIYIHMWWLVYTFYSRHYEALYVIYTYGTVGRSISDILMRPRSYIEGMDLPTVLYILYSERATDKPFA